MMKRTVVSCALVAVLASVIAVSAAGPAAKNPHLGKIRHVVMFGFKSDTTPEQVQKLVDEFGKLKTKIPFIVDYEWGTNCSPENLAGGLTHCFLVTFANAKDRDAYLPHPAHKAYVEILKPHLDKVTVLDYVVKE